MQFRIEHSPIQHHVETLKALHRSAYPTAIRNTLNDAVFDVKTKTMPEKAKVFKKRQPNFFKANSKFEKAQGFDVPKMKSIVGFYENKLAEANTNYAVKDLEQQEHGGAIKHKTFIAMKKARIGNKNVRADFRLRNLHGKTFVNTKATGKTAQGGTTKHLSLKQQFIRAAIFAESKFGKNAFVLGGRNRGGNRTLSLINGIRFGGKLRENKFELSRTPIYNVHKGRVTTVKQTNFMKRASLETGHKMNTFFIKQAARQFQKFKK